MIFFCAFPSLLRYGDMIPQHEGDNDDERLEFEANEYAAMLSFGIKCTKYRVFIVVFLMSLVERTDERRSLPVFTLPTPLPLHFVHFNPSRLPVCNNYCA